MANESRLKSILKAISWRIIATSTTFTLAYTVFSSTGCEGALEKSTLVALLEMSFKLVIYYFHERIWLKVPGNLSFKKKSVDNDQPLEINPVIESQRTNQSLN